MAVSAAWRHGAERLDWIAANGLACAFTPNPDRLDLISRQLIPYIDRGMAVRHHGFFPGSETDRHWAPRTMDILAPIVDRLLTTACRWWTIELEDTRDICRTRQLLADHFEKNRTRLWWKTEAACVLPA
ncbi:MAG: hypothetical protein K9J81_07105 [Desulfohalobiaceae bacterium]|nr:hypothetical protein [Desulfohalobiaceae bacterium]